MRAFAAIALAGLASFLVNILSQYADQEWGLSDSTRISFVTAAFFAVVLVHTFFEVGIKVPGLFAYHRFWYLRELGASRDLSRWTNRFAPLELGKGPRYTSAVEVLEEW